MSPEGPSKPSAQQPTLAVVFKESSDVLADPLTRLFRKSLAIVVMFQRTGRVSVAVVFKNGEKYLCFNYRPISLTCVISNVMEHIVCSSLMSHAEHHNVLYPCRLQHGNSVL